VHAVDHIIVVVEESADRIAGLGVARDKLSVVSNTPPLARLDCANHKHRSRGERIEVVYMGNLEVVRGLLESVDAVALLKSTDTPIRLRVIGRGRDETLIKQRSASHGLGDDDIAFLGYIESHADALQIVSDSDVGLMPHRKNDSWDTTIPNKLFDYMAAGLPVVSSNAAPCERILSETGAGRVFQSGDAHGIAAAIREAGEPDVAAQLGASGRQAIRDRYNWEYDTSVLLEAVDHVLSSRIGI
jgi:glycosyltransferase involved in cell wall biosynthesis